MALKFDDAVFNRASDQAMQEALAQTTEQRLKAMGSTGYSQIIAQLKSSSVDKTLVAALETEVNSSTNKNQVIIDVVRKGGVIAKAIGQILRPGR
jgi:predicted NAD/FAD-binding protein